MSAESAVSLGPSVFAAIGFGGIVAAVITGFANWRIKVREQSLDVKKHKIESISKQKQYLVQLKKYYWQLLSELYYGREAGYEYELCMYYVCCILAINRKIIEEFGDVQLDDLEAESIFGRYKMSVIHCIMEYSEFKPSDYYRLGYFITIKPDITSYIDFRNLIRTTIENTYLLQKFSESLKKYQLHHPEKPNRLEIACQAASGILGIEVNQIFDLWYKGRDKIFRNFERFEESNQEVIRDLIESNRKSDHSYFRRISEFDLMPETKLVNRIFRLKSYPYVRHLTKD